MSTEQTYLTDNNDVRPVPDGPFYGGTEDFNNASFYNGGGNGHTSSRLGYMVFNVTTEGSSNNAIASILSGNKWGASVLGSTISITYSINPAAFQTDYASLSIDPVMTAVDSWNILGYNTQMVNAVAASMARFSAVAKITFTQLAGNTTSTVGDIRWMHTDEATMNTSAAHYPTTSPWGGDIFIGSSNAQYTAPVIGNFGFHAYIQELGHAFGLKHPHADGVIASSVNDQLKYTIMSYKDFEGDLVDNGYSSGYFPTTPMLNDILALQLLYGANMSYNTGNNTYTFTDAGDQSYYYETVWDAGGTDTFNASTHTAAVVLNLNPGEWSSVGDTFWGGDNGPGMINNTVTIAYGTVIENAIGGAGSDTLLGNSANNFFTGNGGDDSITGSTGIDTAVYSSTAASYTLVYDNGTLTVQHKNAGIDGTDTLNGVEVLDFTDRDMNLGVFNPYAYLAANTDLLSAWGGANTVLATQHYVATGFQEGRASTFDGLSYIASYTDLMNILGLNADVGTQHYATNGFSEGRAITFDPYNYLAANRDLMSAWGLNTALATQHYITDGRFEGRSTRFEGLRYIASYGDLINAFGLNPDVALQHYLSNGFREGRRVNFDPFKYLASNQDLFSLWGANADLATQHYITDGFREGRSMAFDGLKYIASYGDLITAIGLNANLGTQHYITNGFAEGRSALFDAEFYLARSTNADLRAVFGTNTAAATQHFITNGFFEGRISTNGGQDTLVGSNFADRLNGGASKDTMTGNGGADTFVFTAASDTTNNSATADIITDFVSGLDKIDLSGIDANTDAGANEAFTTLIASGDAFTAAGQLRLTDGVLYGNTNGDSGAEFAIVLTGVAALNFATDFVA